MVKSMTGFGKITIENGNRKVVIEIKSLNSKTLDLNLKMPNLYKEKEMEIRNIVKEQLDRGKVEMCIYFDNTESDKDVTINKPVVTQYFNQLLDIANELGIEADKNKILQTVMRFPDTLQIKSEELEDTEWEALEAGIKKALEEINKFRIQEGKALIKDICHRIELIQELSAQVPQFEVKRVEVIRQKLQEKVRSSLNRLRRLGMVWFMGHDSSKFRITESVFRFGADVRAGDDAREAQLRMIRDGEAMPVENHLQLNDEHEENQPDSGEEE